MGGVDDGWAHGVCLCVAMGWVVLGGLVSARAGVGGSMYPFWLDVSVLARVSFRERGAGRRVGMLRRLCAGIFGDAACRTVPRKIFLSLLKLPTVIR